MTLEVERQYLGCQTLEIFLVGRTCILFLLMIVGQPATGERSHCLLDQAFTGKT